MKTLQEQLRSKYLNRLSPALYKRSADREDDVWREGHIRYVGQEYIIVVDKDGEYATTIDRIRLYDMEVDTAKMGVAYVVAKSYGNLHLSYDEFKVRPHAYNRWFAVVDAVKGVIK